MKNIIKLFLFLTLIIGVLYPISVTLIGNVFFSQQVKGSLIVKDGKIVGSSLIAQKFIDPKYFFPRPSAVEYNPLNSGASNYGPISKKFKDELDQRIKNGFENDMLFTSGSGFDPHILPSSAIKQIDHILLARKWDESKREMLVNLIKKHTANKTWSILGNDIVNVLELNIDLDKGNF